MDDFIFARVRTTVLAASGGTIIGVLIRIMPVGRHREHALGVPAIVMINCLWRAYAAWVRTN